MQTPDEFQQSWARVRRILAKRFSLRADQSSDADIDERLRTGAELLGSTPWILMLAIFIASIGLNVNSTAVIIGAMLISPLMGPIMGLGYGVGIYDFGLIRRSLLNLGIAAGISLVTSALYFAVSPLDVAQSELLARTAPTIWDVLIALFGGLAGIVGVTRQEKTNVIPGVAIATALMPPLCTAGYGLAHGDPGFFLGAAYLFSINCVFIAVATVVVIRLMRLPQTNFVDAGMERRVKRALFVVVAVTALPSFFLAYKLVGEAVFRSQAQAFVKQEFRFKQAHVADVSIDPAERQIDVTLIGTPVDRAVLEGLNSKLTDAGLKGAALAVHQGEGQHVDVAAIKEGIVGELYRDNLQVLSERDRKIHELEGKLAAQALQQSALDDMIGELRAQYPQVERAVVGQGKIFKRGTAKAQDKPVPILYVSLRSALPQSERLRLERWFQARSKDSGAMVVVTVERL